MTEQALMLTLLISGLILAGGVTFQLVTGMRTRRRAHRRAGSPTKWSATRSWRSSCSICPSVFRIS